MWHHLLLLLHAPSSSFFHCERALYNQKNPFWLNDQNTFNRTGPDTTIERSWFLIGGRFSYLYFYVPSQGKWSRAVTWIGADAVATVPFRHHSRRRLRRRRLSLNVVGLNMCRSWHRHNTPPILSAPSSGRRRSIPLILSDSFFQTLSSHPPSSSSSPLLFPLTTDFIKSIISRALCRLPLPSYSPHFPPFLLLLLLTAFFFLIKKKWN